MLKRHKSLTIVMTLCLCLALLAPVFVAPPAAQAVNVTAAATPIVSKAAGQNLGALIVNFDVISQGYHQAVIKLPDSYVISGPGSNENARVSNMKGSNCTATFASRLPGQIVGAGVANIEYQLMGLSGNQMQFTLYSDGVYQEVKFGIAMNGVTVPTSADATINASVIKLAGDFGDGAVPVGKTTSGAVDVLRTDPQEWGAGTWNLGGTVIPIHVREDSLNAWGANQTLKLKLPKGWSWTGGTPMQFPGNVALNGGDAFTATFTDPRVLVLTRTAVAAQTRTFTFLTTVNVDEDEAAYGDVIATVSGAVSSNMTEVKLGSYVDYGYSVTAEKPETSIVAGLTANEISKVIIKENITASLLNGRSVVLDLPDGCEWAAATFNGTTKAGGLAMAFTRNANDKSKASANIASPNAAKGEIWLDNIEINVAVDFTGPVEIQFSGSAGMDDKVQVATVVAPITATADVKDVKIGVQAQPAGDITITETQAEGISSLNLLNNQAFVNVAAPLGVTWATLPTVKVTEGDLQIGTVTRGYNAADNKHELQIPIKSQSTKASKIVISDVKFTVDRTVPEGSLELKVRGDALDQAAISNRTTAATVVAADIITPAPDEGTTGAALGQFRISSNIYEVNGVSKVMDAAPYIKNDRTYVPIRFLGYACGLTDENIGWDEATQKVTLTKGDNVVELTIGSTTITVNGEAKTMDVAPEITNDRTMLPARFVAEGLGYVVGWDPGSQTILISK